MTTDYIITSDTTSRYAVLVRGRFKKKVAMLSFTQNYFGVSVLVSRPTRLWN